MLFDHCITAATTTWGPVDLQLLGHTGFPSISILAVCVSMNSNSPSTKANAIYGRFFQALPGQGVEVLSDMIKGLCRLEKAFKANGINLFSPLLMQIFGNLMFKLAIQLVCVIPPFWVGRPHKSGP